jgi:hypothetical protein
MADSRQRKKRGPDRRRTIDQAHATPGRTADDGTVDQADDIAAFRREVSEGIRRISGTNGIRDIYATDG